MVTDEVTQSLNEKAAPLKTLDTQMKAAKSEVDKLAESALPLAKIAQEREYWIHLLADINQRIPKDYIWVTSLELAPPEKKDAGVPEAPSKTPGKGKLKKGGENVDSGPGLTIKGLYLSTSAGNNAGPAVVDEFIAKLKESQLVKPIAEASAGFVRENDDNPSVWAYKFVLPLKLQNPINLQ